MKREELIVKYAADLKDNVVTRYGFVDKSNYWLWTVNLYADSATVAEVSNPN
jgi:hypothetical protein